MQPPNVYGQAAVSTPRQRTYRDPRNDPANWNRGGLSTPSFPGVGQTGTGYGKQLVPTGPASSGMMTSGGVPGWNGYGQPANYFGAGGGQSQVQPIGSMSQVGQIGNDQIAQEQARRLRLLKQQQMLGGQIGQSGSPMGQVGNIGQISARMAESPYQQNVTQPFPVQTPWQQRVPQNFNQGTAYDQFTRRW